MGGLEPLTYTEIAAWSRLMGHRVQPCEVDALLEVDLTVRRALQHKDD